MVIKGEGRAEKLDARKRRQVNHDPLGLPDRKPTRKRRDAEVSRVVRQARKRGKV